MSDLISRSKTSDHVKNRMIQTAMNNMEYITSYAKVCEDIVDNRLDTWINEVQAVESEREKGEWIWEDGNIPYCSICKKYSEDADMQEIYGEVSYCSHCGSKMEVNNG